MQTLNNPIEAGVRVLLLLHEIFPTELDMGQLAYLDYCILHSGDVGGPASLHPATPIRPGEFAVKRHLITDGLRVMIQANLVRMSTGPDGIKYAATDNSETFVRLLESQYFNDLRARAQWVASEIVPIEGDDLRQALKSVFAHWKDDALPGVTAPSGSGNEAT
ncbi:MULTISPECIES: ABC-three component system middle component 2 [Streptomyces]|uniref:ABC-three component system middle component 2 n=1 Tax=Streptomyces TaxID=1883 RepID=UPI00131D951E|nr:MULTISPECIES: ABC-three component system middle component 2 [Streptomyces]